MNTMNPSKIEMALSPTRNRKVCHESNSVLDLIEKPYFVGLLIYFLDLFSVVERN